MSKDLHYRCFKSKFLYIANNFLHSSDIIHDMKHLSFNKFQDSLMHCWDVDKPLRLTWARDRPFDLTVSTSRSSGTSSPTRMSSGPGCSVRWWWGLCVPDSWGWCSSPWGRRSWRTPWSLSTLYQWCYACLEWVRALNLLSCKLMSCTF